MFHAFVLISGEEDRAVGRLQVDPIAAGSKLTDDEVPTQSPNFLDNDIRERVSQAAVKMRLLFQIADPGDAIDDISAPWPEGRSMVNLGEISLDRICGGCSEIRHMSVNPGKLPGGSSLPVIR